jgi:hypothetical protein
MNLNHILVVVIVVIVGGTWGYSHFSNAQQQQRLAAASALAQTPVYTTIQVKMQGNGREITLKGVFESPDAIHCQNEIHQDDSLMRSYQQRCDREQSCQALKLSSCGTYVEAKYKDMLNKKPASTRYVHLQNKHNPKERGIFVFWGLNSTEADEFCKHMIKERVPPQIEMVCI